MNPNRLVIEIDGYLPVKDVWTKRGRFYEILGCRFAYDKVENATPSSVTLKPDVCKALVNAGGTKAFFKFSDNSSFWMNLHHALRIYEMETARLIWERGQNPAHIVIAFQDIWLQKGPMPLGEGIFYGINAGVSESWVKDWENWPKNPTSAKMNKTGAFLLLKPTCKVAIVSDREARITMGSEEAILPLQHVVEIYEKETGRRIWPRLPPVSGGQPSTP